MLACFRLHGECKSMRIQDVRTSELAVYRSVYLGAAGENRTGRLRQWTYKNLNRCRKVALATFRHAGLIKLQPIPSHD